MAIRKRADMTWRKPERGRGARRMKKQWAERPPAKGRKKTRAPEAGRKVGLLQSVGRLLLKLIRGLR